MKVVTWEWHVDESYEGLYEIILGRDLLTNLGLCLKISEQVIAGSGIPYEGCMSPMVDLNTYDYKYSHLKNQIKPEKMYMDAYTEEVFNS